MYSERFFFFHKGATGPTACRSAGHSSLANTVSSQSSTVNLLHALFSFFPPSLGLFFTPYAKTNCSPPVVHSTLSKVLSENLKTSCFDIYGDALSFCTTCRAKQSSVLVCLASALNLHLILSTGISPPFFFIFFPMSFFLPPLILQAW